PHASPHAFERKRGRVPQREPSASPFSAIQELPTQHCPPLEAEEGEFRRSHHLLFVFNNRLETIKFRFPNSLRSLPWRSFIDTFAPTPRDIYPALDGPLADTNAEIDVAQRSFQCFIAPNVPEGA
ncbi:MAG: hypothetical protein Q4D38_06450, partial [Planctomycetia bacterium]|nr:hypothetical protein [Planctomycetia bacterium]